MMGFVFHCHSVGVCDEGGKIKGMGGGGGVSK